MSGRRQLLTERQTLRPMSRGPDEQHVSVQPCPAPRGRGLAICHRLTDKVPQLLI